MSSKRSAFLLVALCALCCSARAGTNGLDSSFGSGGIVALGATPNSALAIHRVRAVAADAAGRILVGGMFIDSSLQSSFNDIPAIGRLDAQGNWDTTFGDHGIFVLPYGASSAPYGGSVDRIEVLSDDGVLISGTSFREGFGRIGPFNSCTLLIKLTNAGALDTTFAADNSGSMCFDFAPPGDIQWQHHPDAIAARADDSFYMASPTTNIVGDDPSILIGAVARFDKNGVLDPEFGSGGIVQLVGLGAYHLLSMPGGGVLAAGGSSILAATLLDDRGSPDAGYGTQGVAVFDPQQSSFGGVMQISFDSQQAHRNAPSIAQPALIVHDLGDREVPWAEGERYARYWPDSRLLTTQGLGHNRIADDQTVIAATLRFLRGEAVGDKIVSSANLPYGMA